VTGAGEELPVELLTQMRDTNGPNLDNRAGRGGFGGVLLGMQAELRIWIYIVLFPPPGLLLPSSPVATCQFEILSRAKHGPWFLYWNIPPADAQAATALSWMKLREHESRI
jgi:hypothetical protein